MTRFFSLFFVVADELGKSFSLVIKIKRVKNKKTEILANSSLNKNEPIILKGKWDSNILEKD